MPLLASYLLQVLLLKRYLEVRDAGTFVECISRTLSCTPALDLQRFGVGYVVHYGDVWVETFQRVFLFPIGTEQEAVRRLAVVCRIR